MLTKLRLLTLLSLIISRTTLGDSNWHETGRAMGRMIRNCWTGNQDMSLQENMTALVGCLQRKTLFAVERSIHLDVIPLLEGVELVKVQNSSARTRKSRDNATEKGGMSFSEWRTQMINTIWNVFDTHAIKLSARAVEGEGRRRRRNNMIMPLMVFGLMGLGMILVPMGFQFLAVLGGKALLLAKLALILSSIQGLKKVATSSVNYGLYHSSPSGPWYDRRAEETGQPYYFDNYGAAQGPSHYSNNYQRM